MEKLCATCGQPFHVKRYLADVRKHCSKACKEAQTKVTRTCKQCGNDWTTWVSQVNIAGRPGAGQFCSKACHNLSMKGPEKPPRIAPEKIFRSCEVCQATFRIWPSRKQSARFCSIACMHKSQSYRAACSEKQQGEKGWRWEGGKYKEHQGYIRTKRNLGGVHVMKFEHQDVMIAWMLEEQPNHPFLVEIDGRKKLHPDVDVHHIDRIRDNNARTNLLAVTKRAHALIHHHGRKPEPWECWPPNPSKW